MLHLLPLAISGQVIKFLLLTLNLFTSVSDPLQETWIRIWVATKIIKLYLKKKEITHE